MLILLDFWRFVKKKYLRVKLFGGIFKKYTNKQDLTEIMKEKRSSEKQIAYEIS
jgi:hypothetical protein